MRILKGRRTDIIATSIGLLAIIQEYAGQIFPPEYASWVLFSSALAMFLMRRITTTAPGLQE